MPIFDDHFKIIKKPIDPLEIGFNLAIECKKSVNNWVFFPIEGVYSRARDVWRGHVAQGEARARGDLLVRHSSLGQLLSVRARRVSSGIWDESLIKSHTALVCVCARAFRVLCQFRYSYIMFQVQ